MKNIVPTSNRRARSDTPHLHRLIARALITMASIQLARRKGLVVLPNELAVITKEGRESLMIDPTSTFPVASKWLLYRRGSQYNYGIVSNGVALPLGPSPDAPYQANDWLPIFRLGLFPGSTFGMATATAAITQDDLVYDAGATTAGCIADLTLAANGTYWVVGRCLKTVPAGGLEVAYAPCEPFKVTVTAGVFSWGLPA